MERSDRAGGSCGDVIYPVSAPDRVELHDESAALATLLRRVTTDRPIRIAVDAEWLGAYETGAQVVLVELLSALSRRDDVELLRLYDLPDGRIPGYAAHLSANPKITQASRDEAPLSDIFWRPQQPEVSAVASGDRALGSRIVATVLDLISYANRRYHGSDEIWCDTRRHVRAYLRQLDGVTTISRDVADSLLAEVPGLEPERVSVTPLGVEHLTRQKIPTSAPAEVRAVSEGRQRPFLLVLGNDFIHKNRDFAVKVWHEVADSVEVDLVLAGLPVGLGSGEEFERPLRESIPANGSRLHLFEAVPATAKTWLLANASVVLYPSAAEGFGFIPYEAASLGTPTVLTRFGPLAENLPPGVGLDSWSVSQHAAAVLLLLRSDQERERIVAAISKASENLTWDASAGSLMRAFTQALQRPEQLAVCPTSPQDCVICGQAVHVDNRL